MRLRLVLVGLFFAVTFVGVASAAYVLLKRELITAIRDCPELANDATIFKLPFLHLEETQ
ncbi:MAG: hypothetical protein DMG05_17525 [Acidobacteria bacterium]|nr:MAG: hypothetical protein DMG05_17525 [Acidobacteriota bacterium]